jgi:DNA-directed RNA polymerase subunit K/omega
MADRVVRPEQRITQPYMTTFEISNALSVRSKQLSEGSAPMVDYSHFDRPTAFKIAELELRTRKLPLEVRRTLPNGDVEVWKISDFLNDFSKI